MRKVYVRGRAGASAATASPLWAKPSEAAASSLNVERPDANTRALRCRGVDYVAMEAANGSLGLAGEEFTVAFEKARLLHAGKDGLAERVDHVSQSTGDGLGYDIRSFETSGEDRLIEVKTTKYGPMTPFIVTRNEVAASHRERERFHLYRAYDFRSTPRLFSKAGPLEQSFQLDPMEYVARIS
ncbi:MAG: DUF3883 domain-containing protein [Vicinamibacteria bacterium]